jgi:hypothetical protein
MKSKRGYSMSQSNGTAPGGPTTAPPPPQQPNNPTPQQPQQQTHRAGNILSGLKKRWSDFWQGSDQDHEQSAATAQQPDTRSALDKMRDTVAEFDEDYKGIGERVLGAFMTLVGHVGPFALALFVGTDLGKYFSPVLDTVPAFGIAYTLEAIIAASTIAMGRAFEEMANGKANWNKTGLVVAAWVLINASSAFGMFIIISTGFKNLYGVELLSMIVRVAAIALGDLACSVILMFKGRSLAKHIESIRKRASAIGDLSDAQRGIEEADKNAKLREDMMRATLQIQEDMAKQIGQAVNMVMSTILTKMEKALKDDDTKNEKTYGRR